MLFIVSVILLYFMFTITVYAELKKRRFFNVHNAVLG